MTIENFRVPTSSNWCPPLITQTDLFGNVSYMPITSKSKENRNISLKDKIIKDRKIFDPNKHLIPADWRTEGIEEFPCLLPFMSDLPQDISGVDERIPANSQQLGLHGFCHDYVLNQKYNNINRLIQKARSFHCAFGLQFTVPLDGWRCDAVDAIRKNRISTLIFQLSGIPTIQTVSITNANFYGFAYDGLASNTVTAIENMCVMKASQQKKLFRMGIEELLLRKSPTLLVVIGNHLDFPVGIPVVYFKSRIQKLRDHDYNK